MIFGLGNQLRPCLRVAACVIVFAVLSVFYILQSIPSRGLQHADMLIAEERNASQNTNRHDHFLVWSNKCKIPDIDPYQKSVMKLMKPSEPIICSNKPPLTYVERVGNTSQYRLVIDSHVKNKYISANHSLSCCFSVITRINFASNSTYNKSADDMYRLESCQRLENATILDPEVEFMLVKCHSDQVIASGKKKRKEVYTNMHAIVPIKEEMKWKLAVNKSSKQQGKLSIFLLGLDSISRLNMIRKMPKTVSHLTRTGWVELKGYNKVGDNTLPNLMAFLTGHNMKEVRKLCWRSPATKFDECPFIWKNYSEQGYITLYAEDEPTMSTFNYHKTGFVTPPTDYYLRPYVLAAEQHLSKKVKDFMAICLGPVSTTDHVLQYTYNFLSLFRDALYFGLVWLNNFSHNNPNTPGAMDSYMVRFFEDLSQIGAMNSTMIVFLSDHGMRFGKIRETSSGWLEERLPFVYIWIPEWFRKENPVAYQNLIQNSNHLTSPFDIHVTLRNFLDRSNEESVSPKSMNTTSECLTCVDLFSDAAKERSCEDAGITTHWCTCCQYRTLRTDERVVQKAAKYVVNEIQSKLQNTTHASVHTHLCATLQLHNIVGAKVKLAYGGEHVAYKDYLVTFVTIPGEAIFESTVRHWGSNSMELQGVVSRLNSYSSQSKCIADSELKLFCFCVN